MQPDQPHTQDSDTELMEQAALWLLKLQSADCTEQDRLAFLAWQQQDPQHAAMAEKMQANLGQFEPLKRQQIPHQIVERSVKHSQEHELFKPYPLLSVILILCLAVVIGQLAMQQHWFADRHNAYNAWAVEQLADHSEIKLSGQTAYNIHFDAQHRQIELLEGNILVDVAKDATRPFVVLTKYAHIQALGTRFLVHQVEGATVLSMLHSSTVVSVELANGTRQQRRVEAGQQLWIDAQGMHASQRISVALAEQAWHSHRLAIDLMPLDQVLAILQSYEPRKIQYNAAALHGVQVSALLPLDGTALNLLESTLAIQVEQDLFGRWQVKRP
jgi:transmembrane sensor